MNLANRTIFCGDNLDVMRGINSESIDLIYLDPPYSQNTTYGSPIGSKAAGASFKDFWDLSDIDLAWHGEIAKTHPALYQLILASKTTHSTRMMSYLIAMSVRTMEMHRVLKPTGSIFMHVDQQAGHYVKLMMDCIFGQKNFISEIAQFTGSRSGAYAKYKPMKTHENIYAYAKNYGENTYNIEFTPYKSSYLEWFKYDDGDGRKYLIRLDKNGNKVRRYLDESPGVALGTNWTDCEHLYNKSGWFPTTKNRKEMTNYPTQKPIELLRRIVRVASNPGDVVLDPFCGCATTCVASELEGRKWVGIDLGEAAQRLVLDRMDEEIGKMHPVVARNDFPVRTDLGEVPKYNCDANKKYLYGEQGGYCNGCETHFEIRNLTVDHIVPRKKAGHDHISNLQLLCGSCNSHKGTKTHEELLALLTDKGWIKRKMAA